MPPQISLNELYQMKKKKEHAKTVCFDKIIELCHRRIRNIAAHGGLNTFYEIPGLLMGFPLYNIYDCMNYVVDKLRKNGFLIQILPPPHVCVIYISWDPNELKPSKATPLSIRAPSAPPSIPIKQEEPYIPRFVTKTEFTKKKFP
jgi:hypothetical protein